MRVATRTARRTSEITPPVRIVGKVKLIRLCGALHSRIISTLVSIGAAGAGLLWAAFDRDGLSVLDRLSGTVLEMVPPGR